MIVIIPGTYCTHEFVTVSLALTPWPTSPWPFRQSPFAVFSSTPRLSCNQAVARFWFRGLPSGVKSGDCWINAIGAQWPQVHCGRRSLCRSRLLSGRLTGVGATVARRHQGALWPRFAERSNEQGRGRQHKNLRAKGLTTVERHDMRSGRASRAIRKFAGLTAGGNGFELLIPPSFSPLAGQAERRSRAARRRVRPFSTTV